MPSSPRSAAALARTIASANDSYNLATMIGFSLRAEVSLLALVRAHRKLYAAQRRPPYDKNLQGVQNRTDAAATSGYYRDPYHHTDGP